MSGITEIGANIATPIALVGFTISVVLSWYALRTKARLYTLKHLPEKDRATYADESLRKYGFTLEDIPAASRVKLAESEMRKRFFLSLVNAILAAVVFLASLYMLTRQASAKPPTPVQPGPTSDVTFSDIRFLDNDPEKDSERKVMPSPAFNRLQATFSNRGNEGCVIRKMSLSVVGHWCAIPFNGSAGIVEPAATYHITLPLMLTNGEYDTDESFLFSLAPQETSSVEIIVDTKQQPSPIDTTRSREPQACNKGTPILLAKLSLTLEDNRLVESEEFLFTLPNPWHFSTANGVRLSGPPKTPSEWVEERAGSFIGEEPKLTVMSEIKHNAGIADEIANRAKLKSPQVQAFITETSWLRSVLR